MHIISFIGIGIPELLIISIVLSIPVIIVFLLISYLRKQTKLKQEQNRLLKEIVDKLK